MSAIPVKVGEARTKLCPFMSSNGEESYCAVDGCMAWQFLSKIDGGPALTRNRPLDADLEQAEGICAAMPQVDIVIPMGDIVGGLIAGAGGGHPGIRS